MKALILTLGLGLVAALLPSAWSEQSPDLLGKWYPKAIITDRDVPEMKVEASTPVIVTPVDGDREVVFEVTDEIQGQCRKFKATLMKTQEPGKYLAKRYGSMVYVKPLPVKGHIVMFYKMDIPGYLFYVTKLLGRDMSRTQESLEAFKEDASAHGFNLNNIFFPKQTDTCPAEEQ